MAGLFDDGGREAHHGGGPDNLLSSKIGGIPVALLALGGIALVWILSSRKSSSSSTTTSTTSPAPGTTGSLTPQQYAAAYATANPTTPTAQTFYNDNASLYGGSVATTSTATAGPVLQSISPTTGPPTGGGTAIISGQNFANVTAVEFGGVPAAFSISNAGTIFATIPPDAQASGGNTVQVTVVNKTASVSGLNFRYSAASAPAASTTPSPTAAQAPASSPANVGMGIVTTAQGQMIWLGTITAPTTFTGYNVGGGAPVYYGNAQTLKTGTANIYPGADVYTPVAYASLVSKTPTGAHEHV